MVQYECLHIETEDGSIVEFLSTADGVRVTVSVSMADTQHLGATAQLTPPVMKDCVRFFVAYLADRETRGTSENTYRPVC